jgi:transcription elongation factor GreA
MRDIVGYNPTLAETAVDFLANLPSQDRERTQAEVHRFIRWFGLHRRVTEIGPLDIASYAEHISPAAIQPVKSFLGYIHRKGFTKLNLAPHLRVKKISSKTTTSFQQGAQTSTSLTPQGFAKLEAELAALKSQRSHISEELHKAAADKDFRENAPLDAARERKSHLEGRIQELESILKSARIMDENRTPSKVKIGDTVVLSDLSSSKEFRYVLVDCKETNPGLGKISIASPLGQALLGKESGQTIELTAPAGTFSYRIKNIR